MVMRKRFRRIRRSFRSGRRRTRWLAIQETGITIFSPNTGTQYVQLDINDSEGPVPWAEFIGGTLARVILHVEHTVHRIVTDPGSERLDRVITHSGLFMTDTDVPTDVIWNPANPHGDYMQIRTMSTQLYRYPSSNGGQFFHTAHNYPVTEFDTLVRRRIDENMRLWYGHAWNMGPDMDFTANVTGRVLIALP